jgi:hypothetical protein
MRDLLIPCPEEMLKRKELFVPSLVIINPLVSANYVPTHLNRHAMGAADHRKGVNGQQSIQHLSKPVNHLPPLLLQIY